VVCILFLLLSVRLCLLSDWRIKIIKIIVMAIVAAAEKVRVMFSVTDGAGRDGGTSSEAKLD